MNKLKIAISMGDVNGISPYIALKSHKEIIKLVNPTYLTNKDVFKKAASKLDLEIPKDFTIYNVGESFNIKAGKVSKKSGKLSFESFRKAVSLTSNGDFDALVTLPINKEAWNLAGVKYKGHTEALEDIFEKKAIMMIGCKKLFGAFFTHHIPLKDVHKEIKSKKLINFFISFYQNINKEKIAILAFNPHGGDNGIIGDEDKIIKKAIKKANEKLKKEVFFGPLVPDTAFTPNSLKSFNYFIAMYHDQGLIPLKALYFRESINVSLNLPIIRTSVDHGTAFDKAYKDNKISTKSYVNAIKEAIRIYNEQSHKFSC